MEVSLSEALPHQLDFTDMDLLSALMLEGNINGGVSKFVQDKQLEVQGMLIDSRDDPPPDAFVQVVHNFTSSDQFKNAQELIYYSKFESADDIEKRIAHLKESLDGVNGKFEKLKEELETMSWWKKYFGAKHLLTLLRGLVEIWSTMDEIEVECNRLCGHDFGITMKIRFEKEKCRRLLEDNKNLVGIPRLWRKTLLVLQLDSHMENYEEASEAYFELLEKVLPIRDTLINITKWFYGEMGKSMKCAFKGEYGLLGVRLILNMLDLEPFSHDMMDVVKLFGCTLHYAFTWKSVGDDE